MSKFNMRFFYKQGDCIYYINETKDTLYKDSVRITYIAEGKFHYYECYKGYTSDVDSLIKFRKDFLQWTTELAPLVDYRRYFSNGNAVEYTFMKYSTNKMKSLKIEQITFIECMYMESTNNGGWMKLNEEYKDKTVQSYGYDQTSFYPHLLAKSDFRFPIKQGHVYYMDRLDYKDLYFGIYKCDIVSTNPDFCNFFTFSKKGYYTHSDILFAHQYRKKYNVTITLNLDCDDNCLLYEESDLIDSKFLFNDWYTKLSNAKSIFKKNKVIKHLMSSLWGYLIKFDRLMCDDEDVFNNLDISKMTDPTETEYKLLEVHDFVNNSDNGKSHTGVQPSARGYRTRYTYIKSDHAYKNNLARLKPFFTSFARNYMVKLLISEGLINNFIRSHTDNIVLNVPHDFTHLPYYPKYEEKSTGLITWSNVNKYEIN